MKHLKLYINIIQKLIMIKQIKSVSDIINQKKNIILYKKLNKIYSFHITFLYCCQKRFAFVINSFTFYYLLSFFNLQIIKN